MSDIGFTRQKIMTMFSDWRILLALIVLGTGVGILQAIAPRSSLLLVLLSGGIGYMFLTYLFPFAAFVILLFLALTVWLSIVEVAFGISLMVAVGFAFTAVWLWRLAFQVNTFVKVREYGLLLALLVMIVISNLFNWGGSTGFYMTFTYLQLFLLFVLVVNLTTTPHRLHVLSITVVASSTLVAALILLDQVGLLPLQLMLNPASNILVEGGYTRVTRASGLWGGPNMTAVQLTLALPFILEWWPTRRSLEQRLLLLGLAVVIIVALVFTFSVGGIIGLVTILLTKELINARRHALAKVFRIVFVVTLAVLVLSITLPDLYKQRFVAQFIVLIEGLRTLDEEQLLMIATERGDAWFASVQSISESPWVGHGPGNAMATNAQYSMLHFGSLRAPHNMFLSVGTEVGLIGMALFGALLFSSLLQVSPMGRARLKESVLQQTGDAIFIALVAYIVQGMALDIQNLKLLWILLGMAAVYGRLRASTPSHPAKQDK